MKSNLKQMTYWLIIIAIFTSCEIPTQDNVSLKNQNFFFSTESYFNEESKRLASKKRYTKTVNFNGAEETMKLDTLNLVQEFSPFINSDINKVIWLDDYQCDTLSNNQTIEEIDCHCKNDNFKTQSLNVIYIDGVPAEITIENVMNKMLLETKEYLNYTKNSSYHIKRVQRLRTGGVDSTFVKVLF